MVPMAFAISCAGMTAAEITWTTLGTAGGATVFGGRSPSHEIEQIYYLGVLDPEQQIPPMLYRIRVRGQSSILSTVTFASGWVPARLADSLGTSIRMDKTKGIVFEKSGEADANQVTLQTGRRLVMFGPQGFREAPRDHRLVIAMGSDSSAYFQALDDALGTISAAIAEKTMTPKDANDRALRLFVGIQNELEAVNRAKSEVAADLAEGAKQEPNPSPPPESNPAKKPD